MVAFTSIAFAATALLGLSSAAPAVHNARQIQVRPTGVVHRIYAGSTAANGGLHFEPQNVVAEIGDTIEWHFLPKNHTVVQSSFDKPCQPLGGANAVFAGFNFATQAGESKNVFSITVTDKNPFWYYCSQPVGDHCKKGMSGVINQNFNSQNTLAKYQANSVSATLVQPSANINAVQNGMITANKPL